MYTFCKQERLCSQKRIDALFQSGHRIMVFPYSIHWQVCPNGTLPEGVPAQVLIATSKRKFHHAVDRNRVKRLTRECYRLHKPALYQFLTTQNINLVLSINYIHTSILDFPTLNHKFDKITDVRIEKIGHLQSNPEA